jgi:hypothetical protein
LFVVGARSDPYRPLGSNTNPVAPWRFSGRRPPILRAEQELTRAQRSSRCPSRSELAPLFAAPASGESGIRHTLLPAEAGPRTHQRVVARAAPCGASNANPSRLAAGGALTGIDPPSDVLCRLAGTAS